MNRIRSDNLITIFMCGDVMTGRGIDQILTYPSPPAIHEPYMKDAGGYVALAEETNGLIPRPAAFSYIWGDALKVLSMVAPDLRIANLETSVTRSEDFWKGKGINYRMSPENFQAITTAGIDYCSLANNHVLDWGYPGLTETLSVLDQAQVKHAGAGRDLEQAQAPAIYEVEGKGRVLIFSCGTRSSGISPSWSAAIDRPGVFLLPDLSGKTVAQLGDAVRRVKRPGDLVVISIHWGGNWGYNITPEERVFAHRLVDEAGVDAIHGHSSHHVKGMEVYRDKPILYGCGDFINDYEGIHAEERFRSDLALMYFIRMDPQNGRLAGMVMKAMQMRQFKLNHASRKDAVWLRDLLNREGQKMNTQVKMEEDGLLALSWVQGSKQGSLKKNGGQYLR